MLPSRRRKKRTNYGVRTVEINRGPNGFGFTISGQNPCRISCIVSNSPADLSGLRAGDFLISVNGNSVSKITHDSVVNLIGNSIGPIQMTIAENYYSDSSDEELDVQRLVNSRKPKYINKSRHHRPHNKESYTICNNSKDSSNVSLYHEANNSGAIKTLNNTSISRVNFKFENCNNLTAASADDEGGPIEYKALIGYIGTIEMPKQLPPNSRLQTVCSCIRKLRQEKRSPTAVLMTVLPTCLTLKNSMNSILAIYPTNRVVYIGSTTDKESRYFGIVTSATTGCESIKNENSFDMNKIGANIQNELEISSSCHVFVTDPKICDHNLHCKKAETFKINCTTDVATGNCLEFPQNALYIVNLVQTMYKLQSEIRRQVEDLGPIMANSPQPSASSNSDSGIGFRDDFFTINDRILLVEFPAVAVQQMPLNNNANPPMGIDLNIPPEHLVEFNSIKNSLDFMLPNNLSDTHKQINNLNNIRACKSIKNNEKEDLWHSRLSPTNLMSSSDDNNTQQEIVEEITMTTTINNKLSETTGGEDNISVSSSKSVEFFNLNGGGSVFKTPALNNNIKSSKNNTKFCKVLSDSCDNLDKYQVNVMNYKLSPKVYGLSKPNNYSCEELNNLDFGEKCGYGSLQDLTEWNSDINSKRHIAQSEPDVRFGSHTHLMSEQNGQLKNNNDGEGPNSWSHSFEKLLEDPVGLHTLAEFLKKEFSAENIYFWTACERYRQLPPGPEKCAEARRIHEKHLCAGAPEPVNVDAKARQCSEQSLQMAADGLFLQAQKQIYNLMKFDSYPRFLKSSLYKECLTGQKEKPQLDTSLLVLPQNSNKLKKSLSNAEDRRRKSLLPWHRKNRSKSKDRGETDYVHHKKGESLSTNDLSSGRFATGDVHSSRSSLTSLDLAITSKDQKMYEEMSSERTSLCRVILSNGSTTVVQIRGSETIQQLVRRLLEKRGLTYSAFEVTTDKHPKAVDLNEPSIKLAGCEVSVEQRVVFKLDLPNRKVISVKSKYTKVIVDVLRPILHKYNYSLDQVTISKSSSNEAVNLSNQVTTIDNARLNIQLLIADVGLERQQTLQHKSKNNTLRVKPPTKLEEITNQVFDVILQEKAECVAGKPKSDRGSVKSEDWGSEHSSGIFGRFLRRDSASVEKRKKSMIPKIKDVTEDIICSEQKNLMKKPLIAKWKTGVNRQQVKPSESDELVEGLTRAQRSRLEDQRGTEINYELPEFLKDKENERNFPKPMRSRNGDFGETSTSRLNHPVQAGFSRCDNTQIKPCDYENYNLPNNLSGCNNLRPFSPSAISTNNNTENGSDSFSITSNLESVETKKQLSLCSSDPPPLPPKPKNVPIKPPNWGNPSGNFYNKPKDIIVANDSSRNKPSIFLEHPSSSFV